MNNKAEQFLIIWIILGFLSFPACLLLAGIQMAFDWLPFIINFKYVLIFSVAPIVLLGVVSQTRLEFEAKEKP